MRKKHLNKEEKEALLYHLEHSKGHHTLIVTLLLLTGFRTHELFALRPCDISYRDGTITLWDAAKRSNGRVAGLPLWFLNKVKRRKVPEGATTLLEVLGYKYRGGDIETFKAVLRRSWGKIKKEVFGDSLKLGLHSLRHTFAMELYSATTDPVMVNRALGHKSLSSTLTYLEYVNQPEQIKVTKSLFERKVS